MTESLLIYGAGGCGREVAWIARETGRFVPVAFIDDRAIAWTNSLIGLPVLGPETARSRFPSAAVAVSVGAPKARAAVADRVRELGWHSVTLIDPSVRKSDSVRIGHGSVICAGAILTVDIVLGTYVHVNTHCTIAHDSVLEDFATLAPGVGISGNVRVERGAYLGTNASVINGMPGHPLVIGAGAIVGAGACVVRDVAPGATVVGVPARPR